METQKLEDQTDASFWAILEIMGHQRFAGKLSEQTLAGHGFIRIDVPAGKKIGAFTKLFGPGAIYGISPVTEEIARAMAEQLRNEPFDTYVLTPALQQRVLGGASRRETEQEHFDEDGDDDE